MALPTSHALTVTAQVGRRFTSSVGEVDQDRPSGSLIKAHPTLSLLFLAFGRPPPAVLQLCAALLFPHLPRAVRWWRPNQEVSRGRSLEASSHTAGHGLPGRCRGTVAVRALLHRLVALHLLATAARLPRRRRMRGGREIPIAG